MATQPDDRPTAVILLAHGSRRTSATDLGMHEAHRRLQERLPDTRVGLAFFEFLHPTLEELTREFAAAGVARAVVMPYFLFAGKEIQHEIPAEIARVRALVPGVELHQARELGVDDRLIEHVAGRVAGALRGLSQCLPVAGRLPDVRTRGRLGVVVCNRGSRRQYDPGDCLRELCDRLQARLAREEPDVLAEPAQAENSEVTVEVAARRLVAAGARRVVVVPYLHFPGKVLAVNVVPAVRRAQDEHPAATFYLAWTLCVNDPTIDICVDRIRETGLLAQPAPVGA